MDSAGIQPVHAFLAFIGSAIVVCGFLARIAQRLKKTNDIMEKFMMEHEMLVDEYCERRGITKEQLPTRMRGLMGR